MANPYPASPDAQRRLAEVLARAEARIRKEREKAQEEANG